ncbi:hypothetical protein [Streptomyces boninensis]|uniref:hypothetical protein n=1 Tax=Streptomyces boninensis TaxID=2039455 RepID=UPI003B21DCF4
MASLAGGGERGAWRRHRIRTLKRYAYVSRLRGLLAFLALAATAATAAAATCAVAPWPAAACSVAAVATGLACERHLHRREVRLVRRLGQVGAGLPLRAAARGVLLGVPLTGALGAAGAAYPVLVLGLVLVHGAHVAVSAGLRGRRKLPVLAKNVDLGLELPAAAPRRLAGWPGTRLLTLEALALLGAAAALATDVVLLATAGAAAALAAAAAALVVRGRAARRAGRMPRAGEVHEAVGEWLRRYRPEVVLYHSGSKATAYQVNMWMDTIEQLDARVLVILREKHLMPLLKHTALPVLCVPESVRTMKLDLSSARVVMYAANAARNINILRLATARHVMLGHGDSDKFAFINPYTKVYDEVWVAGQAARDRYAEADVGVPDERLIEVGRPQVDELWAARTEEGQERAPKQLPTVLYAPTWEGWTDDPGNSSIIEAGENIVRRLLEHEPPVRVHYKPHALTGTVDPRAREAHRRIADLLKKDSARRAEAAAFAEPEAVQQARAEAAAELDACRQRLAELSAQLWPRGVDEVQRMKDTAGADPALKAAWDAAVADWHRAKWASVPAWEHQVIRGQRPYLNECFGQADLLISDISSVVADFVATLKPYAVVNTTGLDEAAFRGQNTTVGEAAHVLDPAAEDQVPELVDLLFHPERDARRAARGGLRTYLLGDAELTATERFNLRVAEVLADERARVRRRHRAQAEAQGALGTQGGATRTSASSLKG